MPYRIALLAGLLALTASPLAAKIPTEWDGLVRLKAKNMDAVFLMPDADFRGYSKVIIDRPQIAFRKDWKRDFNASSVQGRISDEDMRKAIDGGAARFETVLKQAYAKAGYEVVDTAGPDVLRILTGIMNVSVTAPDMRSQSWGRTYASETGEGQLVLEVSDSVSGALLGRALDYRVIGENGRYLSDAVSNRAEFDEMFRHWAEISAAGLTKLKSLSPIDVNGKQRK